MGRPAVIDPEFGEAAHLVFGIIAIVIGNDADVLVGQVVLIDAAKVVGQGVVFFGGYRAAVLGDP